MMKNRFARLVLAGAALLAARGEAGAVCARVRIEIAQQLTLTRQGFEARLTVNNGQPVPLEGVSVTLFFKDDAGNAVEATSNPNSATAKFFVRPVEGREVPGRIEGGAESRMEWLIIPAPSAGGAAPSGALYYVGARLGYTAGGVAEAVEVDPDWITVLPMPELRLDYFLPEDVEADDPHTGAIEPAQPFWLGVRVANTGFGGANQLRIESAQPRIVDNEQGLLIRFRIEGASVNGAPVQRTLLADFGAVPAQRSSIGFWEMTTTLSGRFVDFGANFSHADELGGSLTALISNVVTHMLVAPVRVDLAGRDALDDFLARDGGTLRLYESGQLGDGPQVRDVSSSATVAALGGGVYRVTAPADPVGLIYLDVSDPEQGRQRLDRVVRGDGRVVHPRNVWLLRRRGDGDAGPVEHRLRLFDPDNHAGLSYQVHFADPATANAPPVLQFPGRWLVKAGEFLGFFVTATDPNGTVPRLAASLLPAGAAFTNNAPGRGMFEWTPLPSQAGSYAVRFTASDGMLSASEVAVITVAGGELIDAWREEFWPGITDPSIIGNNADPDGDGLKNLLEYALGMDPTQPGWDRLPVLGTVELGGKRYLTLTYERRANDATLAFEGITSGQAGAPEEEWILGTMPETLPDQNGVAPGMTRERVRDLTALEDAGPRRFLKLRVKVREVEP